MVSDERDGGRARLRETLNFFRKRILPLVPPPMCKAIEAELERLEELLVNARPPRFAIVGRRGAGKSTLINAIFGAPVASVGHVRSNTAVGQWYRYTSERGEMRILDTRGLGEGSTPAGAAHSTPFAQIGESVKRECPDAILFLCKGKEVDARIDDDIANLREIVCLVKKAHSCDCPVVGVVTQVDELDPPDIFSPPFDEPEKRHNIDAAVSHLRTKLIPAIEEAVFVLPVCAYIRFNGSRVVGDRRWNIDALIEYLIEHLPQDGRIALARIARVKGAQKKIARVLVSSAAMIAGGVGATPIPVGDLPIIAGIQIGMIMGIAYVAGRELTKAAAAEFLGAIGANIGVAFVFREAARALVKVLFPAAGNVVSGAVAAAGTWAIGEAAIAYFIDDLGINAVRALFQKRRSDPDQSQEGQGAASPF